MRLNEILKSGTMRPSDFYANNILTPEQSNKIIDAITAKDGFLGSVTTDRTKKLQKTFDIWNLASGVLVRVPSGERPSDEERRKIGVKSVNLDNKPVQLFARITQDTLEDNANNPKFESQTFTDFSTTFSNDLQNLGLNGVKDDYADKKFENLNKGWLAIANESDQSIKFKYDKTSKMINRLSGVVKAAESFLSSNCVLLISKKDLLDFQEEIGKQSGGLAYLLGGGAAQILGTKIITADFMPVGTYLLSDLKNLIFSIGLDVRRTRWYDNDERALKYTFEMFCDYEIALKNRVVIASASE